MTENRHRLLPDFLYEGFASRIRGGETFTFVYLRDGKARETSITNVSSGAVSTPEEGKFASLFEELRGTKGRGEVAASRASELIAHFCARTARLRQSQRKSSEFLLAELHAFVLDTDNLKALIINNPELIREQFERASSYIPTLKLYKGVLQLEPAALVAFLVRYRAVTEMMLQTFVAKYKGELLERLSESYTRALAERPILELRAPDLQSLRWFVCESMTPLIFGDVGCVFETAGVRRFKPVPAENDAIRNVFLPLSSGRMLIGTSLSLIPQVDFNLINEAIAKCSGEFFVCSVATSENNRLVASVGAEAGVVSREELEQLIIEMSKADYEWLNVQAK